MFTPTNQQEENIMTKQLPPHLQAIFDKRAAFFKKCGCDQEPAEFLIECQKKANARGDDNALIHAVI